jgi:hypothetical protein
MEHRLNVPSLELELRRLSLGSSCVGNERVRIDRNGRVEFFRNERECAHGEAWTGDWRPLGVLDPRALQKLGEAIQRSGVLDLPALTIDESVEGGGRVELDLRIGPEERHLAVQNSPCPAFETVVRQVLQMAADLRFTPPLA